ncbi:MAG: VWA domain-containing protein [Acidobacteria bacterium]|nr:VWA domain-containing protein [Acidobacteriota bacterium]
MLAQQPLPDSPAPQITGVGTVTPGRGTPQNGPSPTTAERAAEAAPAGITPGKGTSAAQLDDVQKTAPDLKEIPADTAPIPNEPGRPVTTIYSGINFVEVPFTVKDKDNRPVAGLTWRDVRVFEDGVRQQIRYFSVSPVPLSVALVIDQSLDYKTMDKVNEALKALPGAFTPYDSIAIFTYNNGPQERTTFTGAQSNRVVATIQRSRTGGREGTPMLGGPMSQNININGGAQANTMPLVNTNHGQGGLPRVNNLEKEVHTLNDAILMAAQALRTQPKGRRRVLYVISDGKEYGSKAKFKDVVKYLQTNNIQLNATLVGDSAVWGIGWLNHFHLPYTMRDNILPQYVAATGGEAISEFSLHKIEESFAKIAGEARNQYTVGYVSHTRVLDPKFRSIEVQVMRPNLDVIAKKGYYPTPEAMRIGAPQSTSTQR